MLMLSTPESGTCNRKEAFSKILIPEATRTYQPLPNKVMIDMIYNIADECNIELTNEQLGMDLKGQRLFGVCDIEGKDFFGDKIKMMIGFCNSYNKSMSARFCLGGKVMVCSNLSFYAYTDDITGISGMTVRPHKNLHNMGVCDGLVFQIREAFKQIEEFRNSQERFYEGLTNSYLRPDKAYAIIVRAAQVGVVNKTKILSLANEWDYQAVIPKTDEREWYKEFVGRNAYSLFNVFTQVGKERMKTNPVQANISTLDLTNFFYKEFQLN